MYNLYSINFHIAPAAYKLKNILTIMRVLLRYMALEASPLKGGLKPKPNKIVYINLLSCKRLSHYL